MPGGLEESAGFGCEFAIFGACGCGEEVEFFPGPCAGDVEEALALGGVAGGADAGEPLVKGVGFATFAPDGREHDMREIASWDVKFEPVQKFGAAVLAGALQGGDEDYVPFEALGFVNGADVDSVFAGTGLGVESLDGGGELDEVHTAPGLLGFAEGREEDFYVGELLGTESDIAA